MKETATRLDEIHEASTPSGLAAVPGYESKRPHAWESAAQARAHPRHDGIEVREDELGSVTAQRLYKMRCECGRSWFELDLPKFVRCPACHKLDLVLT